jgi:NAD(P)-dependent dehydrogenase (short-subunit alcohol dehydrogenase family)
MDLAGKVALITGGKRIGAAVAAEFARRGADIALTYRSSRDEAEETAQAVTAAGRRAWMMEADLGQAASCRGVVAGVVEAFGRLDVLVSMASIYRQIDFDALQDHHWEANLAVDLGSSFHLAHAAAPHLRKSGGGRIVLFSDWIAASGRPRYKGFVPYYVAKSGVIALTEALALELAADNILVNAIAPGPIVAPPGTGEEESEAVKRATPLGRWGGESEIVKAVVCLIETDFITGEVIRVDGGRHIA